VCSDTASWCLATPHRHGPHPKACSLTCHTSSSNITSTYRSSRNTGIAASTHPVFRHQPTVSCKPEATWGAVATGSYLHLKGVPSTPHETGYTTHRQACSPTQRGLLSHRVPGALQGTDTAIAWPAHTLVTPSYRTWSCESQGTSLNLPVPGGAARPINTPRDKTHSLPRRLLCWTLTLLLLPAHRPHPVNVPGHTNTSC
jgi:hypothetical protein